MLLEKLCLSWGNLRGKLFPTAWISVQVSPLSEGAIKLALTQRVVPRHVSCRNVVENSLRVVNMTHEVLTDVAQWAATAGNENMFTRVHKNRM